MSDNKSSTKLSKLCLEDGEYLTEIPPRKMPKKDKVNLRSADDNISEIRAPIPGIITAIFKKENEFVKSSETLLRLEAMKMENEIISSAEGRILKIKVKPLDRVAKGEVLAVIKKG